MALGDEPWPMGEDLVELVKVPQLGRDGIETLEPALVSALLQKLGYLLLNQIGALVTTGSLREKAKIILHVFRLEYKALFLP